ncbi:DUF2097 domain-containing protein [Methanobacterium congolense]|uniref:DUF2097 domain-containing protein n=1 Tax=Methanobacterium congolense TaxID=118062 RepID=A0A1D3KZC6_9EURY|nr:DUF2097 domain-containing protein [Methanobacterium congolense]SCG84742.1 putative protein [Methanobacterium congolense]
MKKEEKCASCEEICQYIEDEVKPGDTVRLSLGRCYIPGKVVTNNDGVLQINVDSSVIKGLTCIDVKGLKEFIVELEHECKDGVCTIEATDD